MTPPADIIIILSTPTCGRCGFVEKHLTAKGVPHLRIDITDPENSEWEQEFRARNLRNVPQTLKGDSDWIEGVDLDAINRLF